jgi:hypothetical protein
MRAVLLLAGLIACAPIAASAQTEPAPAAQTPSALSPDVLAAARAVVEAQGGLGAVQATLSALRNQLVAIVAEHSNKPAAEVAPLVDELILPELKAHAPDLVEISVAAYASHFTLSELQELRAFAESPVGRKVAALLPTIAQETSGAGQVWGRRVVTEAIKKHAEELKRRGLNL